jgi:uncharacterized protein with PhoU and TrkA domain
MFVGKSLRDIDLRAKHGLTLIAIKRTVNGALTTSVSPPADHQILEGDVLALVGGNQSLLALERMVMRKS